MKSKQSHSVIKLIWPSLEEITAVFVLERYPRATNSCILLINSPEVLELRIIQYVIKVSFKEFSVW